jgi:hypothetical protein
MSLKVLWEGAQEMCRLAISDAKRNHLFDRSSKSKTGGSEDMKQRGIFHQFDSELRRALLEVGIQGEWDRHGFASRVIDRG